VNLSNPVNATLSNSQGVVTIVNDDTINAPPQVAITSPAKGAIFIGPVTIPIDALATDIDGTIEKVELFGNSIKLGETTTGSYRYLWQNLPPGDYTLFATATDDLGATANSLPINITVLVPIVVVLPAISISDVSIAEGSAGTTNAVLTVSLSASNALPVTVNWATVDGTAHSPSDYISSAGILTFAPGETNRTISIVVNSDTLNEADETFFVNLTNAVQATISAGHGTVTIRNDDNPPQLSISNVTVTEGDTGTTNVVLTVSLSAPSGFRP